MTTDVLVSTKGLTKTFGQFTALDDCTVAIGRSEVFGLLGPNGAGKTTLIRLLMGFLKPSRGQATIGDLDCYRQRVEVHKSVSYLPGDARMFRGMRAKSVLKFFARVHPLGNYDRSLEIADRLELNLKRWVAFMSTGMRQKLALSVCLATEAPLLILDEPTANLDPTVRREVLKLIAEAKRAGRTVIFSSHVLSEIEQVCDQVVILKNGKLVHSQTIAELKQKHRILARLQGALPPLSSELDAQTSVTDLDDNLVQIESSGDLKLLLKWLTNTPLEDVLIEPMGLNAIYDQFHPEVQRV